MFGFCISSVMLQNLLVLLQASSTPVPLSQEIHTLAKVSQVTGLCGGYLLKHVHQLLADLSGKGKSHTMAMRETTNVAHQSHSITVFSFSFLSTSRTFFPLLSCSTYNISCLLYSKEKWALPNSLCSQLSH